MDGLHGGQSILGQGNRNDMRLVTNKRNHRHHRVFNFVVMMMRLSQEMHARIVKLSKQKNVGWVRVLALAKGKRDFACKFVVIERAREKKSISEILKVKNNFQLHARAHKTNKKTAECFDGSVVYHMYPVCSGLPIQISTAMRSIDSR